MEPPPPKLKRKAPLLLSCTECEDHIFLCDNALALEQHFKTTHNLSDADATSKAQCSAKSVKKGVFTISSSNISVFEKIQKTNGTAAGFKALGFDVVSNQVSLPSVPETSPVRQDVNAIRQQLMAQLLLDEDEDDDGNENHNISKEDVCAYLKKTLNVTDYERTPYINKLIMDVIDTCSSQGTAQIYQNCLSNWGVFLAGNEHLCEETAMLSSQNIERFLKCVMNCTTTAVAQYMKAIKKALLVTGSNDTEVLKARLLHRELDKMKHEWILPLLAEAAERRHQLIASKFDAKEVIDAVAEHYFASSVTAKMKDLATQVISPEGRVIDPTNWNNLLKFITARLVIGQSMRAGNLAGIRRKDFLALTLEEVGEEISVVIPIKKHKVQRYKSAYISIPLEDYETFVVPLSSAANRRALDLSRDPMEEHVFQTRAGIPIRKSEFIFSHLNKSRENPITSNIVRHCSTKLVLTGQVPGFTIQEHARVLVHKETTATKVYMDICRKETAADAEKYRNKMLTKSKKGC